jgi:hypothetical protein
MLYARSSILSLYLLVFDQSMIDASNKNQPVFFSAEATDFTSLPV